MRRTFGDEFYWNIFKEYVHEIMTFNDLGLEFFVEGTRSRTAKVSSCFKILIYFFYANAIFLGTLSKNRLVVYGSGAIFHG